MSLPIDNVPASWNESELRLLRTVDLFQQKPGIMQKAEVKLAELNLSLQGLLNKGLGACPQGADTQKGQIARGENHKGFPYLSLDMPQLLNKQEFFTFRTLFWWGHYLGFSLILKGGAFELFQSNLVEKYSDLIPNDIYFCVSETPWDWGLDKESHLKPGQATPSEITNHCNQKGFIKLLKVFPMHQPEFPSLDWSFAGLQAYRQMIALISKPA